MKDALDIEQPLTLPHAEPPAQGTIIEVAPGIRWARLPLPFRLNHVNVWLLEEPDGWTLIDCGLDDATTREVWQRLVETVLEGRPIRRIIATHGHTDHVGLAGHLVERFDVPFLMTLGEWQAARLRYAGTRLPVGEHIRRYLAEHGCDPATIEAYAEDRRRMGRHLGLQPDRFQRLRNGDEIVFGGRRWQVIVAGGHADEHASFYSAEDGILIAGDQILQRITPSIGVYPEQPDSDPLSDYLASLPRFGRLPPSILVLPSHGLPFYGLHRRVADLADHHDERLGALETLIDVPRTATECSQVLFERAVREGQGRLALGETLAHLHHLRTQGRAEQDRDKHGRIIFLRVD
ncbi:MAG: MBL fold metallo-hydrolase [Hyphomicrobiaceae bacterium]|nr:MBL fold metallo-hydrolase [Hyphomicrobiaceae bacterium]